MINPISYSSAAGTKGSPRSLVGAFESGLSEKILGVRCYRLCRDHKDPVENVH